MSSNNISLTKRGRIPKVHRMANTGVKSKTDVDDLEDKLLQQSLLDSFSVEKYSKKDTFTKSGELKEEFNQRIYEVETIQKMVHLRLKNKELEIETLVQKNTELSEIVSKLETDKLEAINDNTRLARRIRGMVDNKEVDNKEVSDLKVEKSKLLRKIEEKEDKVSKLVELIKPLRERVTEQEKFKEQLNQASGENKSLHVVNEEFKEALDNKEKELQIVKTLLDKTKQTIGSEEMRLMKERKQLKEKELKFEETQLRISQESKSFQEFKLQVTAEKLKWTDEKSAIEVEKKTIQDDKMTMDRQQADLNQLKITLREEKHTLSADKKAMQDEQKELDEDKMMLHIEWGDIWTKKNQLEKLANSQDADINVQEKQEQLDKLVTENKSMQAKIDLKNAKLEDLFQKYNLLEDKLNVSQEGSRKEIADIKALCSEIKSAKKAQKKDLESKDMKLTSLQDEMKSTKSYYEKKMDYRSKQKIMLKKEIRQKNEEIVQLKESLNSTISNKRKQMDDVFSCEECGVGFHSVKFLNKHMKDVHESPEKAESGPDQIIRRAMEESQFPSDLFGEIEDLEFQEEYDVENSVDPQTGMNDDDEIEEYYDDEEFDDNKVLQNEDLQRRDNDHWKEDYDEEELEEEEEYYDVDENEQDDIEVISSGVKKLPQFSDEIEVVEDKSAIKRNILNQRPMVRNQSLNNIKNRYSQITITNNAVMPDDDGSPDDEDYSDLSDEDNTGVPEEITLDDEPDEITLDEEEEGIEDITEVSRKGIYEKEQIDRIERYEAMIAKTDFVKDLIETPENVSIFRLNAWYAQPSNWKPTKLGEVWNATVPQICFHLKLHDYPLQSNWSFRSWEAFDEFFTHLLENLNPGKLPSDLYKLKKAKWFQYLDPVIPQEMRITVETLEEEDLGEDVDILTL